MTDKLLENGFAEVTIEDGMNNAGAYTGDCSGSRSDCCTRTCSADANFVDNASAWDAFLSVEGGQVQY